MSNLTVLLGVVATAFILVYMLFKLGDNGGEHGLLQLLVLFLLLGNMVILGKVVDDSSVTCQFLLNYSDENRTNSNDYYTYNYYNYDCRDTTTSNTADIFYNAVLWLFRIFSIYIVLYYVWVALGWISNTWQNRR